MDSGVGKPGNYINLFLKKYLAASFQNFDALGLSIFRNKNFREKSAKIEFAFVEKIRDFRGGFLRHSLLLFYFRPLGFWTQICLKLKQRIRFQYYDQKRGIIFKRHISAGYQNI